MTPDHFTPPGEQVIASDGLPALKVGSWWPKKHHYIQRYQEIFSVGMSKRWPNRVYVDLFSGPGRCAIASTGEEIDGSPIVASSGKRPFSHYFFVDGEEQFIKALERRLGNSPGTKHFFVGDANLKVSEVTRSLPSPGSSLGLAFLDPFGWELDFTSIEILTAGRRMDLMITFHTGQLSRFAEQNPRMLDRFFGRETWYDEYIEERAAHPRRERSLLDVYEKGLVRIGYPKEHIDDEIMVRNTQERILYHIIFASKNPKGKEFWKKISQKSVTGQARLL